MNNPPIFFEAGRLARMPIMLGYAIRWILRLSDMSLPRPRFQDIDFMLFSDQSDSLFNPECNKALTTDPGFFFSNKIL